MKGSEHEPPSPRARIAKLVLAAFVLWHGSGAMTKAEPRGGITPVDLRCNSAVNPLGIDSDPPRLSWRLAPTRPAERRQRQTAYRILVSESTARLSAGYGDLWDTGKIDSAETLYLPYAGKALAAGKRFYWTVRVWDRLGRPSDFASPVWFETAVPPSEWNAEWIDAGKPLPATDEEFYGDHPAPLFRKPFRVDAPVRRARAYVTGLGYAELRLNGRKVGDSVLDPAWTDPSKRVFYSTYDVTGLLREGENVVGIAVGNGWYNPLPMRLFGRWNLREILPVGPPRCILRMEIETTGGASKTVVTDRSWRVGDGPILRNNVYLGEVMDARRDPSGWDEAGFDDSNWDRAEAAEEPVGLLQAQPLPPIRPGAAVTPVAVAEPQPGVFIVDMGRNFAGWITLRANGPAGTKIRLRFGELLLPDGGLNVMTSVCTQIKHGQGGPGAPPVAWQQDEWILAGKGPESYSPTFTWHGFRYVEVTGYPGTLTRKDISGRALHSDVTPAGSFSCSNERLNRIHEVARNTFLSNLFSVQSDCPHRERLGYGGDIVATSETAMLCFDMERFYAKTALDFADAARPNGGLTETAPFVGIADAGLGDGSGPVGWGTALPLLQWQLHQYYGNRGPLEEHYDAAKRWIDLLASKAVDEILDNGISDHESLVPKPAPLTGTAFYYANVRLLAGMARVLGRREDERRYADKAQRIRRAFIRRFVDPATGRCFTGTQACQAFTLYYDLLPSAVRDRAVELLVRDVMENRGGHLTTGIFGTKYLLDVLSEQGRGETAYTVANQSGFPGWGYMLERGATTLWESWAFSDNTYSHNHPMFGSISEWFLKRLAGIRPDPRAVGFDRVRLEPDFPRGLAWVKGRYDSVRGPIASEWRREGKSVIWEVSLPPNVRAVAVLPTGEPFLESGAPAEKAVGIRITKRNAARTELALGSGKYHFTLPLEGSRHADR